MSPDGQWIVYAHRKSMPSLDDMSRPMLRLAGRRINPATNGMFQPTLITGLSVQNTESNTEHTMRLHTILAVGAVARRSMPPAEALIVALLLSTGLTFGTITAVFGRDAGILDAEQFSLVLAVVVSAAVLPATLAVPALRRAAERSVSVPG